MIAAGLIAMVAVIWATPALRDVAELLWLKLQALFGARCLSTGPVLRS